MYRLGILAVVLLFAGAIVGAVLVGQSDAGETDSANREIPPATGPATQPIPQLVGFTMNVHQPSDVTPALEAVDHLHELGFNALQLTIPVFQENGSDPKPQRLVKPGYSPTDEQVLAIIRRAKSHGMHVNLLWQINFISPRGNEWRGKIKPPEWDTWWQAYDELLLLHATLARDGGADVFTVGCELLSTHKPEFKVHWLDAIRKARETFPGRLIYSSTWDSFDSFPAWEPLDLIGISGWWDLTERAEDKQNPQPEELVVRWREIQKSLRQFADHANKPLLITEVGYPTIPWALKYPWNYVAKSDTKPDPDAQAAGYRSFFDAWSDLIKPPGTPGGDKAFAGVFFYEWSPFTESGGPQDFGYSPRNKPAEPLLHDWLYQNRAPDTQGEMP